MKPIFTDTNIFLRVILNDHKQQSPLCRKLFQRAEKGEIKLITHAVVILEIVWVLTSLYKLSKKEISEKLKVILNSTGLEIPEREILMTAAEQFEAKNIDFIDLYISAWIRKNKFEEIFTYDHDYDRIRGIRRREP